MNLPARNPGVKRVPHVVARAVACGTFFILPSCRIPALREADPGPGLPAAYTDSGPKPDQPDGAPGMTPPAPAQPAAPPKGPAGAGVGLPASFGPAVGAGPVQPAGGAAAGTWGTVRQANYNPAGGPAPDQPDDTGAVGAGSVRQAGYTEPADPAPQPPAGTTVPAIPVPEQPKPATGQPGAAQVPPPAGTAPPATTPAPPAGGQPGAVQPPAGGGGPPPNPLPVQPGPSKWTTGPSGPAVSYNGATAQPTVPLANFNGAAGPENSAQLAIEQFFNDPRLTDLIHQAVANNRELRSLNEDVAIARNEVLSRVGAYLPSVSLGTSAGLEKPSVFTPAGAVEKNVQYLPGRNFFDPLPDYQAGLSLSWTPDIWRQLRNARDAASQRYYAAAERRNYFVTRLVAETAENYYELMALDKRLETLDRTIALQEQSLEIAQAKQAAGRGTVLAVQRFQAEVRRNQSEKLVVRQEMIETENRINFLVNRYPGPVDRSAEGFLDLAIHPLSTGVPAQLLQNRPDIRQAERELTAAGIDVKVARARFFPQPSITANVGYEAFNPKYLFATPDALLANITGNLVTPLINKKAIQADYMTANARQLQAIYNYQRVVLNAFTEVVNRISMVENFRRSIEIKRQQLQALEASVETASQLFQNARAEYIEVLFAQRDMMEARMVLIETKRQQLTAVVNAYQALGGGNTLALPLPPPYVPPHKQKLR